MFYDNHPTRNSIGNYHPGTVLTATEPVTVYEKANFQTYEDPGPSEVIPEGAEVVVVSHWETGQHLTFVYNGRTLHSGFGQTYKFSTPPEIEAARKFQEEIKNGGIPF